MISSYPGDRNTYIDTKSLLGIYRSCSKWLLGLYFQCLESLNNRNWPQCCEIYISNTDNNLCLLYLHATHFLLTQTIFQIHFVFFYVPFKIVIVKVVVCYIHIFILLFLYFNQYLNYFGDCHGNYYQPPTV